MTNTTFKLYFENQKFPIAYRYKIQYIYKILHYNLFGKYYITIYLGNIKLQFASHDVHLTMSRKGESDGEWWRASVPKRPAKFQKQDMIYDTTPTEL